VGADEVLLEIDHIGIAVADLAAAVEDYRASLGIEPTHREIVRDQGVEEVFFETGASFIQLLGALGPDTPVGRFLARRGEGLHHVAYRVRTVRDALDRMRAAGVPLIDEAPRPGSRGTLIAFVHPKGMHGVLIELVEEGTPGSGRA
jgi:methylmalonyl-CoA/ethylmalonyl-CoA epimerase